MTVIKKIGKSKRIVVKKDSFWGTIICLQNRNLIFWKDVCFTYPTVHKDNGMSEAINFLLQREEQMKMHTNDVQEYTALKMITDYKKLNNGKSKN